DADVSETPGGNFGVTLLLLDGTASFFGRITLIATVVVFLLWQHRAYNNLPALGVPRPDFSSGWVVGSWFVPFLNLVRPYKIVKYIRDKSNPEAVSAEGGYYDTGGNFTLKAWWGFWLASNIVVKLGDHVATAWAGIFRSGVTVIAACLAIAIVR